MKRLALTLALGLFAAPAPAQMLVRDNSVLAQAVLEVANSLRQIQELQEQVRTAKDQLEEEKKIFRSQSQVRGQIPLLMNGPLDQIARRYAMTNWQCAGGLQDDSCWAPGHQSAFAGFARSVGNQSWLPQSSAVAAQYGYMAPAAQMQYHNARNTGNVMTALGLTATANVEEDIRVLEVLLDEVRRGHAQDIKGSMDLQTRIITQGLIQQVQTNRLLAALLVGQGYEYQGTAQQTVAAAAVIRKPRTTTTTAFEDPGTYQYQSAGSALKLAELEAELATLKEEIEE